MVGRHCDPRQVGEVLPIEQVDVEQAKRVLDGTPGLSARDPLHVAVMRRREVSRIMSFDSGFDAVPGTLPELADLFLSLGVTEALNLDGGGSSVMVVQGRRVNRPSGPMGRRPVANALLVRADSTYCHQVQTSRPEP
jgi:hypothetical protein